MLLYHILLHDCISFQQLFLAFKSTLSPLSFGFPECYLEKSIPCIRLCKPEIQDRTCQNPFSLDFQYSTKSCHFSFKTVLSPASVSHLSNSINCTSFKNTVVFYVNFCNSHLHSLPWLILPPVIFLHTRVNENL